MRFDRVLVYSLILSGCPLVGFAQEADIDVWSGRWVARVEPLAESPYSARIDMADYAGFWSEVPTTGRTVPGVCKGRRMPITVQSSTTTELAFTVWGSSIAPACPDLTIALRATGASLAGTIEPNVKISLVRRQDARSERAARAKVLPSAR